MRQNKILKFFITINPIIFISLFLTASFLITLVTLLFPPLSNPNDEILNIKNQYEKFFLVVILIPLIETLIFQYSVICTICYFIKRKRSNFYISLLLSAFFFSLNHAYDYYYMIYAFFIGLILAFAFYISRYRRQNSILLVSIIHSLWNLIGYIKTFYL